MSTWNPFAYCEKEDGRERNRMEREQEWFQTPVRAIEVGLQFQVMEKKATGKESGIYVPS